MASTSPASPLSHPHTSTKLRRMDAIVLMGGIGFSLAFTALIAWADQFLTWPKLLPDQGFDWYYWQLAEPTTWTRLSGWGLYTLHQLSLWALIYYAQSHKTKYTSALHPVNIAALSLNAVFIVLHLIQTHIWYDGLAQDTSLWSSQWAVILMLVWILLMENSRRGLFFGKRAPIAKEILQFARRYHGYVFSGAIVYTFWFHPMVSTPGHLWGFFYMFLLILQGSLFFTRIHINTWWTVIQELTVLVHGAVVAYFQVENLWPMFAFGFGGIFIITQMHGLGLPLKVKWSLLMGYSVAALAVYSQIGLARLPSVLGIPIIEYSCALVLALVIGGGLWVAKRVRPPVVVREA